ncbi:molecular chaperone DnaK [Ktedonobacteria bacterium brp13]|nr:molecular chaperone DnaK [Ktedonobacteria bacterium brp13]
MSNQDIVFGIDLGTTYSCIAYVDEYGKAIVIPNSEGDYTTPSVIQFDGEQRIIGREAKSNAVLDASKVVEMVKRQMGDANWRFYYNDTDYAPEEISSYILRKLKDDAELYLDQPVNNVVITCPAYFGIAQRNATVKAGELAGLNVREVINEPTAAAITYGLQEERDQTVLVYDLGGGTFDVTVIEIKGGDIRVIATGGDHNLGGRNWDERLVNHLADQWVFETQSSEHPTESEETLQDLWSRSEEAKKALTARMETKVVIAHAGKRLGLTVTRDTFNELTEDLLDRTIEFTKMTLEQASLRGYEQCDQILLVGGSTRMPQVEARLKAEFAIPQRLFDPEQAVAKGAASYGYKLRLDEMMATTLSTLTGTPAEEVRIDDLDQTLIKQAVRQIADDEGLLIGSVQKAVEMTVTNVASHSFGIIAVDSKSKQDIISNIVQANDPIPVRKMKNYWTLEQGQINVNIQIVENNVAASRVEDVNQGQIIGDAVLHLPAGLPEHTILEVTFDLQRDGRLHVHGTEPGSRAAIEADIETSSGITDEEYQAAKLRSSRIAVS